MTRALTLGVSEIRLNWTGGSDEGHLHIDLMDNEGICLNIYGGDNQGIRNLGEEIEEWGFNTIHYNGAGDGNSYGDNIRYNLKEGTVSTETWWTEEVYGGESRDTMETC